MNYPTREGLPISPFELELPPSRLPGRREFYNNHHSLWTRKRMGELALTQTARDLGDFQDILHKDTHQLLHNTYEPPELSLEAVYKRVWQAFEEDEPLRIGSAWHFEKALISRETMQKIEAEKQRWD